MAFNKSATARKSNAATQDDSWKADGFINIYLPRKNGQRAKVGAIALRDSKESDATLRQFLEGGEENIARFLSKMIVEYQSAKAEAGAELDL